MQGRLTLKILALTAAGTCLGAAGSPQTLTCPAGVQLNETFSGALPPGLVPYVDPSPSPPIGMALFAGNPALGHRIAPFASSHPGFNNDGTDTRRFKKAGGDLWFVCFYGAGPKILAKPLRQAITTCAATTADGNSSRIACH